MVLWHEVWLEISPSPGGTSSRKKGECCAIASWTRSQGVTQGPPRMTQAPRMMQGLPAVNQVIAVRAMLVRGANAERGILAPFVAKGEECFDSSPTTTSIDIEIVFGWTLSLHRSLAFRKCGRLRSTNETGIFFTR
jgi:hypothetical protein